MRKHTFTVCRWCGKVFDSLGIMRHETMHYEKAQREKEEKEKRGPVVEEKADET